MPFSPEASAPGAPRHWNLLGAALVTAYLVAMSVANVGFGRADNADFTRYIRDWIDKPRGFTTNFPPPGEPEARCRLYDCWLRDWELRPPGSAGPPASGDAGSARLFWRAGLALNRAFVSRQVADLRVVALPARLVTLVALLLLLRTIQRSLEAPAGSRRRASCLALLAVAPAVFAAADPRVTTYFHSFYRESTLFPSALISVCGLAGFGVGLGADSRVGAFARPALLFTAGAGLLAANAPLHSLIAFLAAAALCVAARQRGPVPARGRGLLWSMAAILALLLAVVGVVAERRTNPDVRVLSAVNSLFFGALMVSEDPAAHLAAMGLPPSLIASVGVVVFSLPPEQRPIVAANSERIRHSGTLRVLAREPAILPRLLDRAAAALNDPRGALSFATDATGSRRPRWSWWTAAKGRLPGRVWLALLGLLAVGGLAVLFRSDRRSFAAALLLSFAALAALCEIVVAVLGDGFSDLHRHLAGASFLLDVALTAALWLLVLRMDGIRRPSAALAPP